MTYFDLRPDHTGKYHRVTIEQKVVDTTELIALQHRISEVLPNFSRKSLTDLHVTFLHLGRMDKLFLEVAQAGSTPSIDMFLERIQPVLLAGSKAVNRQVEVGLSALDCFGFGTDASLVVKLDYQASWLEMRAKTLDAMETFLKLCGIHDVDGFMASSDNLMFGTKKSFNPHVTLGTVPVGVDLHQVLSHPIPLPRILLDTTIIRNAPIR